MFCEITGVKGRFNPITWRGAETKPMGPLPSLKIWDVPFMVPWVGNIMTPVYPHCFEIFPETQISRWWLVSNIFFIFTTKNWGNGPF